MSQSNALQYDDPIEELPPLLSDAALIVRARFVEAADTMANMEVRNLRPAAVRSFWPESPDMTIGGVSIGYDNNGQRIRYRPSAAAISRAEEVMYRWMLEYVTDDKRRKLLGRWSMCQAAPHIVGSFRAFCKKNGIVRRTAERHLLREFSWVGHQTIKITQSLQEPNWSRVSPMMPNSAIDLHNMNVAASV